MFAILLGGLSIHTNPYNDRVLAMKEASNWLEERGYQTSQVWGSNVWVFYFNDLKWAPDRFWSWAPSSLDIIEPGTILVWDGDMSSRKHFRYDELSSPDSGWERLAEFGDGFVVIFQKQ